MRIDSRSEKNPDPLDKRISLYVSRSEYDDLIQKTEALGMTLSVYLRCMIFDKGKSRWDKR